MKLSNFVRTVLLPDESNHREIFDKLSSEQKEFVHKLDEVANPNLFENREGYDEAVREVFEEHPGEVFDLRDINTMMREASSVLPPDISENLKEVASDIRENALARSKEYHTVALAAATCDAIEDATGEIVDPISVIEPFNLSDDSIEIADSLSHLIEGDDRALSETDDEEGEDDYGFDDDEYYED